MFDFLLKTMLFILGLCLGSFLNVVICRLPSEDQTIFHPKRSACPKCGYQIAWYDNLPLLSYILLRAKCRKCGQPISLRYPMVELMAGVLTLAVFYKSGLGWRALADLYLVLSLVAITFIDLDEMIIPDALTVPGMVIAVLASAVDPELGLIGPWAGGWLMHWGVQSYRLLSVIGSIGGLILGGGLVWTIFHIYFLLRREEGIGGGDFTLLAMIGAFLGWRAVLITMFLGSIAGVVAAVAVALREGGLSLQSKLPFGPFLALGALVYLFFGEAILQWYLG